MSDTSSSITSNRISKGGFVFWTLTTFVPLSTLVLVLAGYGTTLAVEQMFGIPANQLATSASDYLQLSPASAIMWFNQVFDGLLKNHLIWKMYEEYIFQIVVGIIFSYLLYLIKEGKVLPLSSHRISKIWTKAKTHMNSSKEKKFLALSVTLILTTPILLYALFAAAITVAFLTYSIIPVIAMGSAKEHIQTYVLTPKLCKPLQINISTQSNDTAVPETKNSDSKKENFAQCIELNKDGKIVATGRVVVSTSSRLVLFDPKSGKASLHSTEQAVLQSTNEL